MRNEFDAVVVGAGHAGCEAALALARLGKKVLLTCLNLDSIAFLACNPSIGGTAKGHLVCEIDALLEKIYSKTVENKIDLSKIVLTNLRHINILKEAQKLVNEVLKNLSTMTLDVVAFEIKRVWNELGKITGETETEQIIDQVFSKFCLGK